MSGSTIPQTVTAPSPHRSHIRYRMRAPTPHRPGPPSEVNVRVTLPRASWTVPVVRRLSRTVLRRRLVGEECRAAVEVAVCEACSNAVRHADPATHYSLRLAVQQSICLVEVADTGTGFDLPREAMMASAYAVSGRGLALIAHLTDQLEIRRQQPTGTVLRFVKHLHR
ncbi:ATP-binding protein [Phytohabitans sp. ZYX-F-186]|uniref:ATP-binding protein n=1 Tax=Phytohabitans maris TaxID=3071409 RepID=A0ABU0ZER0_9ACTN|nr:ATP-binding protein [Phytohabitans sp. ZYX-F-186]MDQ7905531.1 ATP-binding protein [Phytohabitans sp. ZYX-F-186]